MGTEAAGEAVFGGRARPKEFGLENCFGLEDHESRTTMSISWGWLWVVSRMNEGKTIHIESVNNLLAKPMDQGVPKLPGKAL